MLAALRSARRGSPPRLQRPGYGRQLFLQAWTHPARYLTPNFAGLASKVPAEQGYIPDIEGLAGRARKEAMVKRAFGEDLYDR